MRKITVGFTKNQYDKDGDMWSECILLYFGDDLILKIENIDELDHIISELKKVSKEIKENY